MITATALAFVGFLGGFGSRFARRLGDSLVRLFGKHELVNGGGYHRSGKRASKIYPIRFCPNLVVTPGIDQSGSKRAGSVTEKQKTVGVRIPRS